MSRFVQQFLIALILGLLATARAGAAPQPATVFAAASLTEALTEAADRYAGTGRPRPVLVFAASSTLARQIEQGAPASLFFSADEPWMDYLAKRRLILPESRMSLLSNRLVIVVPAKAKRRIAVRPGFDFAGFIGKGRWVTGDPASVPVGRYAQAALEKLGVWHQVEQRLARADNVRAALAFVEWGDAAAGIVYATDAVATPRVAVAGVFPADSHPPIFYPLALVRGRDTPEARRFYRFLRSAETRAIFRRRGFLAP